MKAQPFSHLKTSLNPLPHLLNATRRPSLESKKSVIFFIPLGGTQVFYWQEGANLKKAFFGSISNQGGRDREVQKPSLVPSRNEGRIRRIRFTWKQYGMWYWNKNVILAQQPGVTHSSMVCSGTKFGVGTIETNVPWNIWGLGWTRSGAVSFRYHVNGPLTKLH